MSDKTQTTSTPLLHVSVTIRKSGHTRIVAVSIGNGAGLILSALAGSRLTIVWKGVKSLLGSLTGK
jgi:hypothetical protein